MTTTTTTPPRPRPAIGRRAADAERAPRDTPQGVPVEGGEPVTLPTTRGMVRGVAATFAQPRPLAREAVRLGRDALRILRGTDEIAPSPKDARFADPAWSLNPGYRRLVQSYLATTGALDRLVEDFAAGGADWREVEQVRFLFNALTSAMAPTNTLLGNPAALKRAFDTAGRSLVRGARNALSDLVHNGGMPSQVDRSAFTVGEDLGVTPGAVVYRDEIVELIQYTPSTPRVRTRPLVIVPPPIGRFYFLDLRPGRSLVEYAVSRGLQVFMISWRNPTKAQSEWDLDTYSGGVLSAVDAACEVTGSPDVTTLGLCAGGQVMTTALNHLAAQGDERVAAAGYAVTLLDFASRAPLGAFSGPRLLDVARRNSTRQGVITARQMGSVFTWMRPDDLVFNYLVRQWLMGEDPPAFDILAWNADGTNLPAKLHEQFLEIFSANALVRPGALTVLGTPVHLSRITVPTFVTGALTDHLTPWHGCYRTTQLLSGPSTFVLSSSGHIQSLVNPPGNPKARYWTGGEPGPDAHAWRAAAEEHTGSWWEPWSEWAIERSGDEVPAPETLGSAVHPPLEPAPGSYVRDRVPART
ncbi:polyhydroxyalkanoate synthase [Geodermatophilus dictyosporus]|uniref:Polyhydroxyalkanoate synthase n=1 Tax=Geodermatophilus dictyosporus TaxID=1523247 RepID=A0A1I5JJV7_9ACTN|nr:alpha/beta fold hydrolase [Geodermatophilus dictyosporus]SFO73000.1 polyhydroxyalkanoate synthase [Geodermatophilus dictyosporus]